MYLWRTVKFGNSKEVKLNWHEQQVKFLKDFKPEFRKVSPSRDDMNDASNFATFEWIKKRINDPILEEDENDISRSIIWGEDLEEMKRDLLEIERKNADLLSSSSFNNHEEWEKVIARESLKEIKQRIDWQNRKLVEENIVDRDIVDLESDGTSERDLYSSSNHGPVSGDGEKFVGVGIS